MSFVVDFRFTNNITISTGNSGTGRTAAYLFMQECTTINPDILCLNYLDYQKNIVGIIKSVEKKQIVIDNADVLLSDDVRTYIVIDDKNQYLIIGRAPKNLFATKEDLFEVVSEKQGEQTILKLKNYL
jgi:hypothetical protein